MAVTVFGNDVIGNLEDEDDVDDDDDDEVVGEPTPFEMIVARVFESFIFDDEEEDDNDDIVDDEDGVMEQILFVEVESNCNNVCSKLLLDESLRAATNAGFS